MSRPLAANSETYLVSGTPRPCFNIANLPWLALFYLRVYEYNRRGLFGWFKGAALRRIFRIVRQLAALPSTGTFHYASRAGTKQISFNARNTQFHSIFSPKYATGYEPETSLLLDACLADSSVFWDVGSNWGHFSLYACSHPKFEGQVHAFEPMPETFQDLFSVVQQSGLGNQITCHNFALGAEAGVSTAALPDGVHSGTAQLGTSSHGTQVMVHAADALNLADPDLIKLDVEGFESAVLHGALKTIQRTTPMIIMESWLESALKTIEPLLYLEQQGYQLFHPVWKNLASEVEYFDTRLPSPPNFEHARLSLVPFRASERLIRSPYMNLFACHRDKLDRLDATTRRSRPSTNV